MAAKRSPRLPKAPPPWRKVTMTLPRDIAKRLCLLAVDRETTIGALAAPALRAMLAGSHFVDLAAQRTLAIADTELESTAVEKGARAGLEPTGELKAS